MIKEALTAKWFFYNIVIVTKLSLKNNNIISNFYIDLSHLILIILWGFPGGSDGKDSTCNVEDLGLLPGLENPMEKRTDTHSSSLAWRIP